MNKKILLIGGGGHCKSVLDSLIELNEYNEIAIIDKKENIGNTVMGVKVVACDDDLPILYNNGYSYAFITIGSTGNPHLRVKLYSYLNEIGFEFPNIIDPSAKISSYAKLDKGIFIGKKVIINVDATIGRGAIINSGSIVEHDCKLGEFVHIAPGVVLGGTVKIGNRTHIGLNTTVRQQTHIGSDTIVGMGSVVTKNIDNRILAYGNPCREVKKL